MGSSLVRLPRALFKPDQSGVFAGRAGGSDMNLGGHLHGPSTHLAHQRTAEAREKRALTSALLAETGSRHQGFARRHANGA